MSWQPLRVILSVGGFLVLVIGAAAHATEVSMLGVGITLVSELLLADLAREQQRQRDRDPG